MSNFEQIESIINEIRKMNERLNQIEKLLRGECCDDSHSPGGTI